MTDRLTDAELDWLSSDDHRRPPQEIGPEVITALVAEVREHRAARTAALAALAEAQRWTDSGGECSIHIEEAEDALRITEESPDA